MSKLSGVHPGSDMNMNLHDLDLTQETSERPASLSEHLNLSYFKGSDIRLKRGQK